MVPISLHDSLRLRATPDPSVTVECGWSRGAGAAGDAPPLPAGEDNLVWQAVDRLRTAAGVESGAAIEVVKRIPAAAGLGGASSDAAAALLAARAAWSLPWPAAALADVAAQVGSDVPFFLQQRAAICRGRGEQVAPFSCRRLHFVVVKPAAGLSTAEVYARCQAAAEPREAEPLARELADGDPRRAAQQLHNRLQGAALQLAPQVGRLLQRLRDSAVGLASQMSGSGTACFALCQTAREARRAARRLQAEGHRQAWHATSV